MDTERKILRTGALVIGCAVALRLLSGSFLGTAVQAFGEQELASVLLFLGTGRLVRTAEPKEPTEPEQTQPEVTQPAEEMTLPVFSAEDAGLVDMYSYCDYVVDVPALLQQPLGWDLTQEGPAVLILHTHGTESYTKTESYEESSLYRTLDEGYNVVSVGERIGQILEAGGVQVVHDRTLHDYPSYNGSYSHARAAIEKYLEDYPSIRMVLDIHRDAAEDVNGNQIGYTVQTEKGEAAKLMLVVGTDAGGLHHPDWQQNMALGVKLHVQLQRRCPEICRSISFRSSRFNQDLSPGALLVEVGAAGNTRQEALLAAEILAQGILDLARGTET